jgi:predicted membrane protein
MWRHQQAAAHVSTSACWQQLFVCDKVAGMIVAGAGYGVQQNNWQTAQHVLRLPTWRSSVI